MDINFHFYAIKFLAAEAGFDEKQAQRIAEYSQFIDDYYETETFKTDSVPPQAAFAANIAKPSAITGIYDVESIPTGFNISVNRTDLLREDFQKRVLVPFHFITPSQLTNDSEIKYTVPSVLNDGKVISNLLNEVYNTFSKNGSILDNNILMQIGCLAHIFSDTYAHEGFSGLKIDSNDYKIEYCERWRGEERIKCTEAETDLKLGIFNVLGFKSLPCLGHTTVGHIVDYTNANYLISHSSNQDEYPSRSRSNILYFMKPLKELFAYFARFTKTKAEFAPLEFKFRYGFNTSSLDSTELSTKWESARVEMTEDYGAELFADRKFALGFDYSYSKVLDSLKIASTTQKDIFSVTKDYWEFTEFAKHIRDTAVKL